MKIIDMHCDTISRIYEERRQGKNPRLRSNFFQLDLEKMKRSGYLLQNFAMFLDLKGTSTPTGSKPLGLRQMAGRRFPREAKAVRVIPGESHHAYAKLMEFF